MLYLELQATNPSQKDTPSLTINAHAIIAAILNDQYDTSRPMADHIDTNVHTLVKDAILEGLSREGTITNITRYLNDVYGGGELTTRSVAEKIVAALL